jgi:hypothetical protein
MLETQLTMPPLTDNARSANRLEGRLAIISGFFGMVAFVCLMAFLVLRPSEANQQTSHFLLRTHDAGIILQALCLIPFALALDALARQHSPGSTRLTVAAAITFLISSIPRSCTVRFPIMIRHRRGPTGRTVSST